MDNSINDRVYPQKADFTFYGGIYRDISLMVVSKNHIALDHFGDTGVKITPVLKDGKADIRVETLVEGEGAVSVELQDAAGSIVARAEGADAQLHLDAPHLWDGVKDPYLYTCVVRLSSDGTVVDEVSTRVGLRTFSVDSRNGFFLNGRPYPLHGVSRHQDRKGVGNAITREMHYKPLAKIEELEEQNYNMIDDRLNNGVEKFNREEEKKEQAEKPQARSSLKERLVAKQKEVAQGKNKDAKEQDKTKKTNREEI